MLSLQQEDGIIEGWYGDGNYARTALMVGLWKTQGTRLRPWRPDLKWGATRKNGLLYVFIESDWDWRGRLLFDVPRHREHLNLPSDYPRINQFPEWFTVRGDLSYQVRVGDGTLQIKSGKDLKQGLLLKTKPGQSLFIEVSATSD